jgi:hypothetical protein
MENMENIKFCCNTDRPDREWIDGEYNIAFAGKRLDEQRLRDYIFGKIAALNTEQLLCILIGSTYDEAIGVA